MDGTYLDIYDLTKGKYDLVVEAGPSYTTQRQEGAEQMIELTRAIPGIGEVAPDIIVANLDVPGAQETAERLKKIGIAQGFIEDENAPPPDPNQPPEPDPEQVKAMQEIQLKRETAMAEIQIKREAAMAEAQLKREVAEYEAETDRMVAERKALMTVPAAVT